jgi:hypothetical protein
MTRPSMLPPADIFLSEANLARDAGYMVLPPLLVCLVILKDLVMHPSDMIGKQFRTLLGTR